MGDNEEHLCFMLLLDNYVKKIREKCMLRNMLIREEEILREFLSDILKKDLVRN